jgi:PAS domain-containing protein
MYTSAAVADEILQTTLDVVRVGDRGLYAALDDLPAAIYVTDANGFVTYFNPAFIGFAGRTPAVGQDRWCVTWRLPVKRVIISAAVALASDRFGAGLQSAIADRR